MATTPDPAVAAANAAKVAAESALENTIDAKIAAQSAEINAISAYNMSNSNNIMLSSGSYGLEAIYNKTNGNNETINNETYGLQSIYNKVQEVAQNTVPIINSIKGSNGATCTTNGIFKLAIQVSGTTEYRAWIDG